MRFTVVSIFPEMFGPFLDTGVLGRARGAGTIAVDFVNPRDFTTDRHRTVDDTPYGGGPGMVMKVEPVVAAIEAAASSDSEGQGGEDRPHRILLAPAGAPLRQGRVRELATLPHIILVCGRYEGVDERVSELAIDEELSIGDFVMTGGELGAMAIIDAVSRYVPGVLGEATSTDEESFSDNLIEYPQYTRPAQFRGLAVPEILQSGHHEHIRQWRRRQSLARTARRRPDLLAAHPFSDEDRRLWHALARELPEAEPARRTYVALVHHPVYDRNHQVVTAAVTNLDVHDIARSSAAYGLAGYYVVSPVSAQRDKIERILSVWRTDMSDVAGADARIDALAGVHTAPDIDSVVAAIAQAHGQVPLVVATSAHRTGETVGFAVLREQLHAAPARPCLLLLGTGWGLTREVLDRADRLLAPVSGRPIFNHLSVRSAAAAILDRLFGLREP